MTPANMLTAMAKIRNPMGLTQCTRLRSFASTTSFGGASHPGKVTVGSVSNMYRTKARVWYIPIWLTLAMRRKLSSRRQLPPPSLWKRLYPSITATAPYPKLHPRFMLRYPFMALNTTARTAPRAAALHLTNSVCSVASVKPVQRANVHRV
jgi:hypothetical protein